MSTIEVFNNQKLLAPHHCETIAQLTQNCATVGSYSTDDIQEHVLQVVAFEADLAVGYVALKQQINELGFVGGLMVDKESRGKGISQRLLKTLSIVCEEKTTITRLAARVNQLSQTVFVEEGYISDGYEPRETGCNIKMSKYLPWGRHGAE